MKNALQDLRSFYAQIPGHPNKNVICQTTSFRALGSYLRKGRAIYLRALSRRESCAFIYTLIKIYSIWRATYPNIILLIY